MIGCEYSGAPAPGGKENHAESKKLFERLEV